jgi:hypothetical protein
MNIMETKDLNLGCPVTHAAVDTDRSEVRLYVARNNITDMNKAIDFAQRLVPDVNSVYVFETPVIKLAVLYRLDAENDRYVAYVPEV